MVGMYPLGPIVEGAGLNMTVMSYCGNVYFGLTGCRETVADIADLPKMITEGLDELLAIARPRQRAGRTTPSSPSSTPAAPAAPPSVGESPPDHLGEAVSIGASALSSSDEGGGASPAGQSAAS